MKRLIRWIINWLYAEEIAALVQEAVDDEFEATWPEAFRHQPEHNSVIPQEIWAAVILRLPNHAEIIHGQWMDNTNHIHILTRTVKLANTTYIREFQLTMDAYRLRLDHTHSRDEIFCGRYAHLLQVQIRLPGNYNSPKADYVLEFSLMQYRLTGPDVEGAVPYWRCNTKPDIVHAFTSETLAGIERGLKHFKKLANSFIPGVSSSKTPSVPALNSWNAKSKNNVIWVQPRGSPVCGYTSSTIRPENVGRLVPRLRWK